MRIPREPAPLPVFPSSNAARKAYSGNVRGVRSQLKARTPPSSGGTESVAPKIPEKAGNVRGRRPDALGPKRGGDGDAFLAGRELSRGRHRAQVDEFHGTRPRGQGQEALPPGPKNGGNTRGGRGSIKV
jgi:hypothetical protein